MGCQFANSQIDVYNGGTRISIQQGAVVAIYGSYIDKSGSGSFGDAPNPPLPPGAPVPLDALIFLSGNLIIHGNIENNNNATNTNLIYAFENALHTGKVILAGAADQTIGGLVPSYFPNLELNKSSGSLILQRNITVDNNFTLTSGRVNLNGQTLKLSKYGNTVGETAPNSISGYPGQLETAPFQLSDANTN